MTAGIALLNKNAAVLAADSAVTTVDDSGRREKIYSADKLFPLRPSEPISVMVYNVADFDGIPWETFIKTYAKLESRKVQGTVMAVAMDFLSYLNDWACVGKPEEVEGMEGELYSGVVFAGFGEEQMLPALVELRVEKVDHKLNYQVRAEKEIGSRGSRNSLVRPFAQTEMVHRFMDGIDNSLREWVVSKVEEQLTSLVRDRPSVAELGRDVDDLVRMHTSEYEDRLQDHIAEHYSNPIKEMVRVLPKDELAHMAEFLVGLTSLKRRVSTDMETVGGPVDVAIVSKGDGFAWYTRETGRPLPPQGWFL